MIIINMKIKKHGLYIALIILLLLTKNIGARGGGRGGGRGGSRGRGMHRGGGGSGLVEGGSVLVGGGVGLGLASSDFSDSLSPYGNTFGSKDLPKDSYISKNDFRNRESRPQFLVGSLFKEAGMQSGFESEGWRSHYYEKYGENGKTWTEEKDESWRETTRAPYFENKIPGEDKILPASAVVGAATAFGLVSLLPLNVPPGKPLMYCGNTDLKQSYIRINYEKTYVCNNDKIEISCRRFLENFAENECKNEKLQCDSQDDGNIYCSNGTLLSKTFIYCDSKRDLNRNDLNGTTSILNCYHNQLPKSQASFVPTTTTTTEWPIFTTERSLSFSANVHVFLLKLMGKSHVLETTTPETYPSPDSDAWHPEALTFPPKTTTTTPKPTTTKKPYEWMIKDYVYHDNGTVGTTFRPVPYYLQPYPFETDPFIPPNWHKVYTTSTEAYKETSTEPTTTTTTTTTEAPFIWMVKKDYYGDSSEDNMKPVSEELLEVAKMFGPPYPGTWIKVPLKGNKKPVTDE